MSKGSPAERFEDDLDRAKARGRWLSDDEQAELDREADAVAIQVEAKQQRDRKLMILTGVCLLIPPLWPVALGLTLFLLYPDTMARIGLAAAITFLVGGLLLAGVLGLAMVWLIQLLFLISPAQISFLISPPSCRRGPGQSKPA
jgi:hypothetical protein